MTKQTYVQLLHGHRHNLTISIPSVQSNNRRTCFSVFNIKTPGKDLHKFDCKRGSSVYNRLEWGNKGGWDVFGGTFQKGRTKKKGKHSEIRPKVYWISNLGFQCFGVREDDTQKDKCHLRNHIFGILFDCFAEGRNIGKAI